MHKAKQYADNFSYAVKIIFWASKSTFIMKSILSLISAVIPYLPLLLWRKLLNALTELADHNIASLIEVSIWFAGAYCLSVLAEKAIGIISEYFTHEYEDKINFYLDNLMVDKISSIDMEFFDTSSLKDHTANSWNLIHQMKQMVTFVFDITQGLLRVIISVLLLLTLNPFLLPVILLMCIPSIFFDKVRNKDEYVFEKEYAQQRRRQEYFKNIFFGDNRQEIRLYHLKSTFLNRYRAVWQSLEKAYRAKEKKAALMESFSLLVMTANEIIIYVLAIMKLVAREIGIGDVAYYASIAAQFRTDIENVAYRLNEFDRNSNELDDVRGFLEMKPLLDKSGTLKPGKAPCIEFCDVSFHYPNSGQNVLEHCSFKLRWDECVGLVGLNGSGKSTLVKLLCRFYDPTEGKILLDGVDYREYDIHALRALFGVLFQDYVKYSLSLRENVALADVTRMKDDASIINACRKSRASEFIESWEKGLEENMTRRFDPEGRELSGGQWQRISLARAFFKDAPIVLLDEPSAALDPVAENTIFQDFYRLSKNKSSVLISHRLSNIVLADRILVLEDGHIIEQGSHEELMKRNGRYARLFSLQAQKYL